MFQQTVIVGRLGCDPDKRFTPEGAATTSFTVAVDSQARGEKFATWFRVSTFGKLAESCAEFLHKGWLVLCVGELRADPNTGSPRVFLRRDSTAVASFEMVAHNVKFLPGGKGQDVDSQEVASSESWFKSQSG